MVCTVLYHTLVYGTVWYVIELYSKIQNGTVEYGTAWYGTILYTIYVAIRHGTVQ